MRLISIILLVGSLSMNAFSERSRECLYLAEAAHSHSLNIDYLWDALFDAMESGDEEAIAIIGDDLINELRAADHIHGALHENDC